VHGAGGITAFAGGAGHSRGNGTESAEGGGATLAGVSYAHNPKPQYTPSARRERWEGRVVLTVLVDEEGRSKSLEVSRSSGFEALDKAAIEAVRAWRFNSARYGDNRVKSWVKTPIEFRLKDAR
jgi:periplasmic protein TonB